MNINLKTYAMKKLILFIVLTVSATFANAQKSIDDLFDKYAGKDGFTTVTINGNLLKLAGCFDNEKDNDSSLPHNVTEVRILTMDEKMTIVDNFYDQVMKDIDLNNYDEFMRIKKTDQNVRMLVRSEGKIFKEFLLIAGGKDNALIQIKGNLTYDEAKKLSEDAQKNVRMNLTSSHNN